MLHILGNDYKVQLEVKDSLGNPVADTIVSLTIQDKISGQYFNGISFKAEECTIYASHVGDGIYEYNFTPQYCSQYRIIISSIDYSLSNTYELEVYESSDNTYDGEYVVINSSDLSYLDNSDANVTNEDGTPVYGVTVKCLDKTTQETVYVTKTDINGQWSMTLKEGTYVFLFELDGYVVISFEKTIEKITPIDGDNSGETGNENVDVNYSSTSDIVLKIDEGIISYKSNKQLIANNINNYTIEIILPAEWLLLDNIVVFENGDIQKQLAYASVLKIPDEVLIPGEIFISVYAIQTEPYTKYVTKQMIRGISVVASGTETATAVIAATPELWEQKYLEMIALSNNFNVQVDSIKADMQTYIDTSIASLKDELTAYIDAQINV